MYMKLHLHLPFSRKNLKPHEVEASEVVTRVPRDTDTSAVLRRGTARGGRVLTSVVLIVYYLSEPWALLSGLNPLWFPSH